ncbi:uncharacterized protein LOC131677165 isoform X2 [Topomyia yanbarensis]|uniref:uncharacterized protein LOC131677165 isoform X2 n=1 Tax=Topomyia yanbarensis TaxID=2498891 RepID=UPI00273C4DD9|nr:uncharacterized protein LOC131677165 isoform X2 [Topomyia yanbarensis]
MMSASGSNSNDGGTGGGSSKSDTSRAVPIKNPLLSMQVTGLTLDDFAHNAMLLPAAPIPTIVPSPPPPVLTATESLSATAPPLLEVSREPGTTDIRKPIVFSPLQPGSVPELQDPDSFSEIDLHSTVDSLSAAPASTVEYNPLQDLEESEIKSLEPNSYLQQTSAITAQFAAQLPTVASTVFSTFSRVIKGSSPGPQQNFGQSAPPVVEQAPVIQAAYDYSQQQFSGTPGFQSAEQQQPLPPPPTFFNPKAVSKSGIAQTSHTVQTGSNTYRLGGSKKKTYAHIPGLSTAGPPSTVVAPTQNQDLNQFVPHQEVQTTVQYTGTQEQPAKSGFSFFEKLPNLLEKIPKPAFGSLPQQPPTVPSPVDYFGVQCSAPEVPAFGQPLPPPPSSLSQPPKPEATGSLLQPLLEQESPLELSENLPPPPTFFTPAQVPTVPQLHQNQPSKNPYSSSRLSRGVGLYKNPLAPQASAAIHTFLPNQEPPKATSPASFFQPPPFHQDSVPTYPSPIPTYPSQPPPPVQYCNPPTASVQSTKPFEPPSLIPQRSSEPLSTADTGFANSRPQSSLSESLNRKSSLFTSFGENPQSEAKTILDSRSKSSENVLSPPPRPNSNLSEPALFSDGQPISLFKPEVTPTPPPPPVAAPAGDASSQPAVPALSYYNPVAAPAQPLAVNFFNPAQVPQQPSSTAALPPPPPTFGTVGSKPYNLQKPRRTVYAVQPNLVPSVEPTQSSHFFNSAAPPQAYFEHSAPPVAPISLFNPIAVQPQLPQLQSNPLCPPLNTEPPHPHPIPPASFFNPIAPRPQTEDHNANPIQQPAALKSTVPVQQDINSNRVSAPPPPPTIGNFFLPDSNYPAPVAPADSLNANFAFLQVSNQSTQPTPNSSDFFNNSVPNKPTSTTGQTPSQVQFFNFFGEPPAVNKPVGPIVSANQATFNQPLASAFFGQAQDNVDHSTDGTVGEIGKPSNEENDEQPIRIIEPEEQSDEADEEQLSSESTVNRARDQAINDSQLDDRYDDPVEQERIGNAPEPIFSSDNLFEFKKSAFEDDTYSKDVLIDANSSSMAAMTATAAAAGTGGTSAVAVDSSMASISETTNVAYRPVYRHWFFKREIESKVIWTPFSMSDSLALEDALPVIDREDDSSPVVIHVDGGRHDVVVKERKMTPVYWKGPSQEVRRCSWFYKNVDSRFVPYDEEVAALLEQEYKEAATSGEWHRRVVIPNGETVVFHGPSVIVHFLQTQNPDSWGSTSPVQPTTNRPRVVKRGVDEFNIEDGEPERIDHLLFMVHGIGEGCDLRFRPLEEVVDEFRSISAQLVQSHYRSSFDRGDIGRVEVLPISWHNDLHSEESGVDKKLKAITLESIPKLRNFTNDTLLDVLFYTSPMFCQSIIDAVGKSLNRLYSLFLQRNPDFKGGVSLAGHSLGSLILFDLLCHQKGQPMETENSENPDGDRVPAMQSNKHHPSHRPLSRKCSQQINYEVGPAGTGQPYIAYPQLLFYPKKFFALGSPIGMFVTVRGIDALGLNFKLPTCEGFFNIFHPYDPVAYRIEALVNPELSGHRPVLIPHHKGRKRMHLELKETMLRVGTDLKQRVLDTFRNTMDAVYSITSLNRPDQKAIEHEVDKVIEHQLKFEAGSSSTTVSSGDLESSETDLPLGQLNQSRRIDYVLQEAPLEFFNEYVFALTSHVCYWESEDTMLFLMKEIYCSLGVQSDNQIPQQSMTIERPIASPTPSTSSHSNYNLFPHAQPTPSVNNR